MHVCWCGCYRRCIFLAHLYNISFFGIVIYWVAQAATAAEGSSGGDKKKVKWLHRGGKLARF